MTDQPTVIVAPKDIYQGEFVIDQMSIYLYTIATAVLIPLLIAPQCLDLSSAQVLLQQEAMPLHIAIPWFLLFSPEA